ncbi:MAG: hypothetical protein NUV49_02030, partial [Patescibacteria group bacterium]|nr:hypothetical protein [Patescibacteria group bacterium]
MFDTTKAVEVYANVVNGGIKETIILKDNTAPNVLQWMVLLNGTAKEAKSGWDVTNDKGEFAFHIAAVTAVDANGKTLSVYAELDGGYITAVVDTGSAAYPIIIDPTTTTQDAVNDAYVMSDDADYATARNRADYETLFTGTLNASLGVGQTTGLFTVERLFQHYYLGASLNIVTITACSTAFYLNFDGSTTDFEIDIIGSNHKGAPATTWANDFYGWAASGAYTVTPYVYATKNTSTLSGVGWYKIPYTAIGIDSLNAAVARLDTHRVAWLSYQDIIAAAPGGPEGISIGSSSDAGHEPYLSFTYTVAVPTGLSSTATAATTADLIWNNNIVGETQFYINKWNYDTSAYARYDSTAANDTTYTATGLLPNTKHRFQIEIDGGTADGAVSVPDSLRTWANVP